MGGYASLQNKRRELEARGEGREGGGERGTRDGWREGGREYTHQQIPQRKPPQNLKDLVTAMKLPAKAEQPENRPQEVLEETCVVQN